MGDSDFEKNMPSWGQRKRGVGGVELSNTGVTPEHRSGVGEGPRKVGERF